MKNFTNLLNWFFQGYIRVINLFIYCMEKGSIVSPTKKKKTNPTSDINKSQDKLAFRSEKYLFKECIKSTMANGHIYSLTFRC